MVDAVPEQGAKVALDELREQLKFETLLAELSVRFVNLPAERVDDEIEESLTAICERLGLDQSSVWQASRTEAGIFLLSHFYRSAGMPPPPDRMDGNTYFPWVQRKLTGKEIMCLARIADAPPDAAIDQQTWLALGVKSTLGFPLWIGEGPVFGVLSFDSTTQERELPDALVKRLQLLAQVFANALARKRSEQELRESEERLRLAAAAAKAGLWTLEPRSGEIWATDEAKALHGLRPADKFDLNILLALVHPDDRKVVLSAIEEETPAGEEKQVEFRIIRADGTMRWISSLGAVRHGAPGEPDRLTGVSLDITERKLSEEALRQSYAEIKRLKDTLQAETKYLQDEIRYTGRYEDIVGQSAALAAVLKKVEQVAGTDSLVLITGESGTGKELIARAIHNQSKRKGRVMVKVDCASLPSTLIESELFGREKGAYTGALTRQIGRFETADGSTLFLDEIGELGMDVQAKLLRVVQDGEFERLGCAKTSHVNVRLIAATHRDLEEKVKNGTFREDLFYRLNVFPIHVPPLRERPEDIPLLVTAFLREFAKKMDKKIRHVPSRMMDELRRYAWPGNIRELRNVIERAVIVTTGEKLNVQLPRSQNVVRTRTLGEAESQHIVSVLNTTGWRIKGPVGAASILGMKPSTLYTTMRRLHIPTKHEKGGMQS
ncbi:MAG: sigma 54-interacting transcriptional regulator [Bryobacteraceae bacterium]